MTTENTLVSTFFFFSNLETIHFWSSVNFNQRVPSPQPDQHHWQPTWPTSPGTWTLFQSDATVQSSILMVNSIHGLTSKDLKTPQAHSKHQNLNLVSRKPWHGLAVPATTPTNCHRNASFLTDFVTFSKGPIRIRCLALLYWPTWAVCWQITAKHFEIGTADLTKLSKSSLYCVRPRKKWFSQLGIYNCGAFWACHWHASASTWLTRTSKRA